MYEYLPGTGPRLTDEQIRLAIGTVLRTQAVFNQAKGYSKESDFTLEEGAYRLLWRTCLALVERLGVAVFFSNPATARSSLETAIRAAMATDEWLKLPQIEITLLGNGSASQGLVPWCFADERARNDLSAGHGLTLLAQFLFERRAMDPQGQHTAPTGEEKRDSSPESSECPSEKGVLFYFAIMVVANEADVAVVFWRSAGRSWLLGYHGAWGFESGPWDRSVFPTDAR